MRDCLGAALCLLVISGCDPAPAVPDSGRPRTDAGPGDMDSGPMGSDAGPMMGMDAGPMTGMDAGSTDGGPPGSDAGAMDAGMMDAGMPDAGMPDAGMPDAGRPDAGMPDAGAPDAGPGGTTPVFYECHPVVLPQQSTGLSVSDSFYTGFRFQVTAGPNVRTTSIGIHGNSSSPVFGAIVALTGPGDWPDSADLTSADVLGTALISVSSSPALATAPISVTLTPGWYMAVFGKGDFGSPAGFGNTRNNSATGGCTNGTSPVSIRQSDGRQITQGGASPHFEVSGLR